MRTKASVGGRPLHPLLMFVGIGALATTLAFDGLHVVTRDHGWYLAALAANGLGAAFLVVGMTAGLTDYWTSVPRRGKVWQRATVHMTMGLAIVGFVVAGAVLRWETRAADADFLPLSALAHSAIANGLLTVQGYIGGMLVKRHRVAVRERAGRAETGSRI